MDRASLHRNAKQRFQQFGINPELKDVLALGLARKLGIFGHKARCLCGGGWQKEIRITEPRLFSQSALIDQSRPAFDCFARQTGAIGEAPVRRNVFGGAVQFLKPRENRGLMLEALVANEPQRRIRFFFRLDAGKPQCRLVRAAEEVVEARG